MVIVKVIGEDLWTILFKMKIWGLIEVTQLDMIKKKNKIVTAKIECFSFGNAKIMEEILNKK